MDDYKAAESWWESESLENLEREIIDESDESADAYLRESWLSAMMAALRNARRSAGLTQQELAERLGTQQPAVSRLEHDEDTTFERFLDYLMACDRMPFEELQTAPLQGLRRYLRANPEAPRTAAAYKAWHAAMEAAEVAAFAMSSVETEPAPRLRDVPGTVASDLGKNLADAIASSFTVQDSFQNSALQNLGTSISAGIQSGLQPFGTGIANMGFGATSASTLGDFFEAVGKGETRLTVPGIARSEILPPQPVDGLRAFWRKAPLGQERDRHQSVAAPKRGVEVAA